MRPRRAVAVVTDFYKLYDCYCHDPTLRVRVRVIQTPVPGLQSHPGFVFGLTIVGSWTIRVGWRVSVGPGVL